jgi:hypothetical protein
VCRTGATAQKLPSPAICADAVFLVSGPRHVVRNDAVSLSIHNHCVQIQSDRVMTNVADHQFDIGSTPNRNPAFIIDDIAVDYGRVYAFVTRIPSIYRVICSNWNRCSFRNRLGANACEAIQRET